VSQADPGTAGSGGLAAQRRGPLVRQGGAQALHRPAGCRLEDVWKRFGLVQALRGVTVSAAPGEVHGLVGENGAGKTTLVRILAGLEHSDAGTIEVGGRLLPARLSPRQARAAGVGLVPQHCEVVPGLTVLENVVLGDERSRFGLPRRRQTRDAAGAVAGRLGFSFDWDAPAQSLGLGDRQRLELVRLLWRDSSVLVLDEPTTVLTAAETASLFSVLRVLAAEGRTIVFITHKLEEIRRIADNVTVLRSGSVTARVRRAEIDVRELARLMIGDLVSPPGRAAAAPGEVRLALRAVSTAPAAGGYPLRGVDLEVRSGEIVGVAGVEGNGQAELCDVVLGLRRPVSGTVELGGRAAGSRPVVKRRAQGLASIPADRLAEGVDGQAALWENATATVIAAAGGSRLGVLRRGALRGQARQILTQADVRGGLDLAAQALSGGNIQRLVVGRELQAAPSVLIAAHPTRGVDVRGAAFIHGKLLELRSAGSAILVISADLDELATLADRVVVMFGGRIAGSYVPGELDAASIGLLMTGAGRMGTQR
jgi:ABC-type uncharacterized transport system ATPase subunit